MSRLWARLARPWRQAAAIIAEEQAPTWAKPPAPPPNPTVAHPPRPAVAPGQALPRRPQPACPDCGAPVSYTIRAWACDQVRSYSPDGAAVIIGLCVDGELKRLPR